MEYGPSERATYLHQHTRPTSVEPLSTGAPRDPDAPTLTSPKHLVRYAFKIDPESTNPLQDWLISLKLEEYYPTFVSNDIEFGDLFDLTTEDLSELIDKVGDRIRIRKSIAEAFQATEEASTPQSDQLTEVALQSPLTFDNSSEVTPTTGRMDALSISELKIPSPIKIVVYFYLENENKMAVQLNVTDNVEDMWSEIVASTNLGDPKDYRFNDSFDYFDTLEALHDAIFGGQIREVWVESLAPTKPSKTSTVKPSIVPSHAINNTNLLPMSGTRPTSEQVALKIEDYFPHADVKALHQGIRNSILVNNRLSSIQGQNMTASSVLGKRTSYYPSVESGSADTYYGKVLGDRQSLADLTIDEESSESDGDKTILEMLENEKRSPTNWVKGRLIGAGSFGSVYLAFNINSGDIMAVKQIHMDALNASNQKILDTYKQEINLLSEMDHKNIVQYLGFKTDSNVLNIFLEYIPGGSLAHKVNTEGPLTESATKHFVKQCLEGLHYLHSKGIIHRDIKGANILVDTNNVAKISDFGLSKQEDKLNNRQSMKGTVYWMAPEVAKPNGSITTKVDIWSLGCLIVELITGSHPFPDLQAIPALFKIGNGAMPFFPEQCSPQLVDFLHKCFVVDPLKRASTAELLSHEFLMD